jgi:hypothetical protein
MGCGKSVSQLTQRKRELSILDLFNQTYELKHLYGPGKEVGYIQ